MGALGLFALAFTIGCSRGSVERVEWTTMGTVAAVQMRGDAGLQETTGRVRTAFADIERDLNRFDPQSELSRLAARTEPEIRAACRPAVSNCYAAAFDLMRQSHGAFNPRWGGPRTLDLGAIAKGFAVDVAAAGLASTASDTLLDLGGNLKSVRGTWRVAIAGGDETLVLTDGMACATSGEYFRGKHIYDGRTGKPVSNDVYSVTVVHPSSAMVADGLSTTLFVLGRTEGERFRKAHHPEAQAVWTMRK